MIFLSSRPVSRGQSSNKEVCLSIIGLCLAMALIGGLAVLISGLTRNNRFTIVTGAIILGVAAFLCLFLVLMIILCFKKIFNSQRRPQQIVHSIPMNANDHSSGFQPSRKPSTFTHLNQSHSSVVNMNAIHER